jgi:hypothetical protein
MIFFFRVSIKLCRAFMRLFEKLFHKSLSLQEIKLLEQFKLFYFMLLTTVDILGKVVLRQTVVCLLKTTLPLSFYVYWVKSIKSCE